MGRQSITRCTHIHTLVHNNQLVIYLFIYLFWGGDPGAHFVLCKYKKAHFGFVRHRPSEVLLVSEADSRLLFSRSHPLRRWLAEKQPDLHPKVKMGNNIYHVGPARPCCASWSSEAIGEILLSSLFFFAVETQAHTPNKHTPPHTLFWLPTSHLLQTTG